MGLSEIIMLEAIGLVLIGAVVHLAHNRVRDLNIILDVLIIAVGLGIAAFAMFGEPSTTTAGFYLYAGFAQGEAFSHLFKPWWESS